MAKRRFRLTKETVDAALKDPKPRIKWDEEVPGFGLRIRQSRGRTSGSFIFTYRPKSRGSMAAQAADRRRVRWLTFGEYGKPYTAEQAREWATAKRRAVDEGKDPAESPAVARPEDAIPTLRAYAEPNSDHAIADAESCRYLHLKANRTKPDPPKASSIRIDRGNLTRICSQHLAIAAKQLHLITPADVKKIVNRVDHRSSGNRWLAVLRHLFNSAAGDDGGTCEVCRADGRRCVGVIRGGFNLRQARVDADGRPWQNPCTDISQYTERGREPEISDEKLAKLLDLLDRHLTPSKPEELKATRRALQPGKYVHKDGKTRTREVEDATPASIVYPHDPFVAGLIKLQLLTGARGSELRTAKRAWLTVTETPGENGPVRSGVLRLPDSKEGGGKTIFLAPDALRVIEGLPSFLSNDFIFPGRDGGCIEQTTVNHWWSRRRAEVGLDSIPLGDGRTGPAVLHDLRHNYAAVLIGEGMSLAEVGELLGHRSEKTTKRYAGLAVRLKAERAAKAAQAITAARSRASQSPNA